MILVDRNIDKTDLRGTGMMNREEIQSYIIDNAGDIEGRTCITCSELLSIAAQLNSNPKDIGALCNELNIKIRNCQLGCFK